MITKNNKFKCDFCGHFISYQDLENDESKHSMITPDSHYSIEEWETICKKCNKREIEK